jgi:hypothetical protein
MGPSIGQERRKGEFEGDSTMPGPGAYTPLTADERTVAMSFPREIREAQFVQRGAPDEPGPGQYEVVVRDTGAKITFTKGDRDLQVSFICSTSCFHKWEGGVHLQMWVCS